MLTAEASGWEPAVSPQANTLQGILRITQHWPQKLPFSKPRGTNSPNEDPRPKKASKALRPEAGWASSPGWFNWLEPLKYADAGGKVSLSVAADTRPELGEERAFFPAELRRAPTVFTGIRSGRCMCVCHSVPRTLRRRLQSLSFWRILSRVPCPPPTPPTSSSSGGAVLSGRCGLCPRQGPYSSGVLGFLELQLPACPAPGRGAFALAGPSRRGQGAEDPGSRLRREEGVRVRAGPARPVPVPIIVNRRRLGGVGMGLPRPAGGAAQEAAVVAEA